MKRAPLLLGVFGLAAMLLVGNGYSQDKKDDTKKDDTTAKAGTLPTGWKKLGLNVDQEKKIKSIRGMYATKIDDLKKQIEKLKDEDLAECVKLLTDDQKALLKKLATDKIDGKDDKKGDDKKGEDKKNNEALQQVQRDTFVARRQD
jgi:hypothetical protein